MFTGKIDSPNCNISLTSKISSFLYESYYYKMSKFLLIYTALNLVQIHASTKFIENVYNSRTVWFVVILISAIT